MDVDVDVNVSMDESLDMGMGMDMKNWNILDVARYKTYKSRRM